MYPVRLHEATNVELLASNVVEGPNRVSFDAKRDCLHCLRLEACRADVATVASARDTPRSMIWAGAMCRHDGTVIATDRELRVYYRGEGQRAVERGAAA
ncbi:hypothetical protein CJ179_48875 [Rhodococcus sp. ACS1]|nr:hypothetical protein CJ179_48875 [Rhodococcus sp. ACS1]